MHRTSAVLLMIGGGLLAATPARAAYDIQAPLSCAYTGLIKVTNSSNFRLPKGARIDFVIVSGTIKQPHSQTIDAAMPIGVSMVMSPVLVFKQPGATTTCTASATFRTFKDVYVKP